ncbi:AI-2E family transporter [Inquilinus ginsengisoli]|uniref:AI-2E family transporter n=1 Tax=Inquilinus ginsengisoli TaxID=363840 RepID=UPI003D19CC85
MVPAAVHPAPRERHIEIAAQILAGLALLGSLWFGLLAALLAGLLIHELVHAVAPAFRRFGAMHNIGRIIALGLLTAVLSLAVIFGVIELISLLTTRQEGLVAVMRKMAEAVEEASQQLPPWIVAYIPASGQDLDTMLAQSLREHSRDLLRLTTDVGRILVHIVIGLVIGGMIAIADLTEKPGRGPLARALAERARLLALSFHRVVFAQVRISALNTVLTAIYLVVVLPSFGVHLPLTKTMIVVTFVVGLLPVIGNLISNTVIVVISLSLSVYTAAASLAFLILIHKLEYFINAKIVGTQIHARAWEILIAMLLMEAAFGVPGVIAAPVFYAYLKAELGRSKLI